MAKRNLFEGLSQELEEAIVQMRGKLTLKTTEVNAALLAALAADAIKAIREKMNAPERYFRTTCTSTTHLRGLETERVSLAAFNPAVATRLRRTALLNWCFDYSASPFPPLAIREARGQRPSQA